LTEKQFLKMMDKQFDNEVSARQEKKSSKRDAKSAAGVPAVSGGRDAVAIATANSDLTDWAFRKLLSCAKTVVALKEPSTKRRICEIFLEKPSPEQFPDYYEIVLKPIAINDILRKCRGKLYGNLQEFLDDWKLMFANASQFNGADSWVAEDGKTIKKELDRVLKKNGFAEEGEKPKSPPKPKKKKIVAEEEVIEAEAKPKSPPKKKKFRIKLSLKNFKNEENAVEGTGEGDDGKPSEPVKKKRKKIKQDTLE